jgi:hypothetical protein
VWCDLPLPTSRITGCFDLFVTACASTSRSRIDFTDRCAQRGAWSCQPAHEDL